MPGDKSPAISAMWPDRVLRLAGPVEHILLGVRHVRVEIFLGAVLPVRVVVATLFTCNELDALRADLIGGRSVDQARQRRSTIE